RGDLDAVGTPLHRSRAVDLLRADVAEPGDAIVVSPHGDRAARATDVADDRHVAHRRAARELDTVRAPLRNTGRIDPLNAGHGSLARIDDVGAARPVGRDARRTLV